MSDTENPELERRLAALEKGSARGPKAAPRRSPLLALVVVGIIGAGGALLYVLSQPEEEVALPTATPDVFQSEGDGFGAIETLPPPEPEVVFVAPDPVEPNAELLAQISALQAQIEELRNAPEAIVEDNTAAAEAIDALTAQIAPGIAPSNSSAWIWNWPSLRPTAPNLRHQAPRKTSCAHAKRSSCAARRKPGGWPSWNGAPQKKALFRSGGSPRLPSPSAAHPAPPRRSLQSAASAR